MGLHVLLAGLPLLSISAHVFGLVPMHLSAAVLVIPLATALAALAAFEPHPGDQVLAHGLAWGVVACAVYDVFRLDTVYLLGLWGDFIPTMGTWITGRPDDLVAGAVVGYMWRYVGDGGGIGLTFFVVASMCGLHRHSRTRVVLVAVGFAVVPVWAGLIGTVALASRGEEMMFPLNPTTVTLSLIGHLIFGVILGLGFWQSRGVQAQWPWAPLRVPQRVRAAISAGVSAAPRAASVAAVPPATSPATAPPAAYATGTSPCGSPGTVPPATSTGVIPPATSPGAVPPPTSPGAVPPGTSPATARPTTAPPAFRAATVPRVADTSTPAPVYIPRQRTSSTPPAARALDPDTWAQWQRRLESTEPGRRAHGGHRPARPARRGPA